MTSSLIARAGDEIGLIVASKFFAFGAAVPFVGARSAVSSQTFCNPIWGTEGRTRLEAEEAAETVLADFVVRDAGQSIRQAHMMDIKGRFAAHTGAELKNDMLRSDTRVMDGNVASERSLARH